ncbi:hypothetical protein LZY01_16770 [Levilactobacillus zymae]|uniref:Uncharacterized protein n=1 Tax=Levilactobacillus zymae TaxID=267363 RepID=A0ABQ0WX77_9LACO|nr:hypothetical protein LZY01_16770 [Levilactobacillus zymae]
MLFANGQVVLGQNRGDDLRGQRGGGKGTDYASAIRQGNDQVAEPPAVRVVGQVGDGRELGKMGTVRRGSRGIIEAQKQLVLGIVTTHIEAKGGLDESRGGGKGRHRKHSNLGTDYIKTQFNKITQILTSTNELN